MHTKLGIAVLFSVILLAGCSSMDIIGSFGMEMDDSPVEVSDIEMKSAGYLGVDFLIKGHLVIDTQQISNEITFNILSGNDVIKETKINRPSGDGDFTVSFKPNALGKQKYKLVVIFRDEVVYRDTFSVDVEEPTADMLEEPREDKIFYK